MDVKILSPLGRGQRDAGPKKLNAGVMLTRQPVLSLPKESIWVFDFLLRKALLTGEALLGRRGKMGFFGILAFIWVGWNPRTESSKLQSIKSESLTF